MNGCDLVAALDRDCPGWEDALNDATHTVDQIGHAMTTTSDHAGLDYRKRMGFVAKRLRRRAALYDALAHPREEAVAAALADYCDDPVSAARAALRASDQWQAATRQATA